MPSLVVYYVAVYCALTFLKTQMTQLSYFYRICLNFIFLLPMPPGSLFSFCLCLPGVYFPSAYASGAFVFLLPMPPGRLFSFCLWLPNVYFPSAYASRAFIFLLPMPPGRLYSFCLCLSGVNWIVSCLLCCEIIHTVVVVFDFLKSQKIKSRYSYSLSINFVFLLAMPIGYVY